MAGMGSRSCLEILSMNPKADLYNAYRPQDGLEAPSLTQLVDKLDVQRIIVQPSPSYLTQQQALWSILLGHGWQYEDQRIDKYGKYHYITSSFVRDMSTMSSPSSWSFGSVQPKTVFESSPLAQRCLGGRLSASDAALWESYLRKQWISIKRKISPTSELTLDSQRVDGDSLVAVDDDINLLLRECIRDQLEALERQQQASGRHPDRGGL